MDLKYSPSSVYVEYNVKGNATKMPKAFGATSLRPPLTINGLEQETDYELRAGVLTANGGSEWSATYSVKTNNGKSLFI